MEFIEHSVAWCRGEIFEGRMLALFGALVVALALVFWRYGTTPSARAIFLPLLIVGAIALITGMSMNFSNQARIPAYRAAYAESPAAFVESERDRTEAFIKWYPYTMYSFSLVILIGCGVFLRRPTPLGRAIGLATLVMGLAVLFLDHFSEERAEGYHAQIIDELGERDDVP
jgi:drug/metabolite transporter (DMT)-like permease